MSMQADCGISEERRDIMTDRTIRRIIRTFQKLDPAQREMYIELMRIVMKFDEKQDKETR